MLKNVYWNDKFRWMLNYVRADLETPVCLKRNWKTSISALHSGATNWSKIQPKMSRNTFKLQKIRLSFPPHYSIVSNINISFIEKRTCKEKRLMAMKKLINLHPSSLDNLQCVRRYLDVHVFIHEIRSSRIDPYNDLHFQWFSSEKWMAHLLTFGSYFKHLCFSSQWWRPQTQP